MEIERFSRMVGRDPSPRKPVRLIGTLIDGHSKKAEGLCWRDRLPFNRRVHPCLGRNGKT